jgi:cytidylate kinase
MIVFIGSFPGTETKKLCKTLALRLGLRHVQKEELEKNIKPKNFEALKQKVQEEEKKGNFITDSILTGRQLQKAVKIFLNSGKKQRAKTLSDLEKTTMAAALEKNEEEEKSTAKLLSAASLGNEYFNAEEFDLVLNIDRLNEDSTIALIEKFLEKIQK